jgi:hypothetical protein
MLQKQTTSPRLIGILEKLRAMPLLSSFRLVGDPEFEKKGCMGECVSGEKIVLAFKTPGKRGVAYHFF